MDTKRLLYLMKRGFLFWLSRKIDYPLVAPDCLQINFTFRCNLRCKMCSMHERMELFKAKNKPFELKAATMKKLIKEAIGMGTKSLILIGGEPFLEAELFDVIAFAKQSGMKGVTVVTNGTLLSQGVIGRIFDCKLDNLSISIDSASEKVIARIRGEDVLKKIVDNIKLLNEMKKQRKQSTPHVVSVCTIMDQNLEELPEIVDLCRKLDIGRIIFQPVVSDNTDQRKVDFDSPVFVPAHRLTVLDNAIDTLIKYKLSSPENFHFIANSITHLQLMKKYFRHTMKPHALPCYAGYNRIQITQAGNLYFCVSQKHHEASFGDLSKDSLRWFWFSMKARRCRSQIRKCESSCLQWCAYRDEFIELKDEFQKKIIFEHPSSGKIYLKRLLSPKVDPLDIALVVCPAWGIDQPPVGVSYLQGYLQNHGMRVKSFDCNLELFLDFPEKKYWDKNYPETFIMPGLFKRDILPSLDPYLREWTEKILSYKPRVVGFSLFMSNVNASIVLARHLKKERPDLIIVAGGPEVRRIRQIKLEGLRQFAPLHDELVSGQVFDILIDGEGEEPLLEILRLMKKKKDIYSAKGILYVRHGKFVATKPRAMIRDLNTLPFPDFSDFKLDSYTRKALPVVSSRGCINRCAFCADSPLWRTYRVQSPARVLKELRFLLKRSNQAAFEFVDSTFNGDMKRVEEICDLLIDSKLPISWVAKASLRKEMTPGLLVKMKKAGCTDLSYGVESGSQKVLNDMNKNMNLASAKEIIKNTHTAGIRANCFFLIGFPTETEQDFNLTLDFMKECAGYIHCFIQVTGCHLEEDSPIGKNYKDYGITFKQDGWHSHTSTPEIRRERLARFKECARTIHTHYRCNVQQ